MHPITRELPSDLPPQPSRHFATGTDTDTSPRHPFSDIAPDVGVVAPNTEAAAQGSPSLGKEAGRSTSFASHRTDRSLPTNNVGESATAEGVEEGRRQKPTIGKEERTSFSLNPLLTSGPFISAKLLNTATDGVGRKLTKIEKRGAKVERTTLHIALQELAEIQELREASIKVNLFFHAIPDPSPFSR
jgi:hypothetical protein